MKSACFLYKSSFAGSIVIAALCFLQVQTPLFARDIAISGKVTTMTGQPLSGVVVRLVSAHIVDTTGADGAYSLSGSAGMAGQPGHKSRGANAVGYKGGSFVVHVSSPSPLTASLALYNVRGVCLAGVFDGTLRQGDTRIPFSLHGFGNAVLLLRARLGARTTVYRLVAKGRGTCGLFEQPAAPGAPGGTASVPQDWLQATRQGYASHTQRIASYTCTVNITLAAPAAPDFGPNVLVFDPAMQTSEMQGKLDVISDRQESNEFGDERYALLFKPGRYTLDVRVGFYMHVLGLGQLPDDVVITGAVRSRAGWFGGNATHNFFRCAENMAVVPAIEQSNVWAVSQAAPFRRMHIRGDLKLTDGGWASGGTIFDSKIDGIVDPDVQQQWISRNAAWGGWKAHKGSWNFVFVGVENPPSGVWPDSPYTTVAKTPRIREKPYLVADAAGNYSVVIPPFRHDSSVGISWSGGPVAEETIPIDLFYVARHETDDAATINAALKEGKHLLFTSGIYRVNESIKVSRPGTVVFGLGFPILIPMNGTAALEIDDVSGVKVAGILIDAGPVESPTLLRVGEKDGVKSHAADPVFLYDIFCRVGGARDGKAACMLTINSNDVVCDHFWLWRADHGTGVGWDANTCANGLIVNGNNVTMYGLFAEHTREYQTIWNGEGGHTYFYQSEFPYDPPDQAAWRHDGVDGYASYKVADGVKTHEARGMGCYCVFNVPSINCANAIEVPNAPGIKMVNMMTLWLKGGGIGSVVNGAGGTLTSYGARRVLRYP